MSPIHLSTGKKQFIFIIIIIIALIASFYFAAPFEKKIIKTSKSDRVSIEELKERYLKAFLVGVFNLTILIVAIGGVVLASKFLADKSWRKKDEYRRDIRWGLAEVLALFLAYIFFITLLGLFFVLMKSQSIVSEDDITIFVMFVTPVIYLIILVLGIYLIARKNGHPFEEIGLKSGSYGRLIKIGMIAFVAYFPMRRIIGNISIIFFGLLNLPIKGHEVAKIYPEQTSIFIKTGIILVVILSAPLFEEIFFRGFLYQSLKKAKGVVFAMLLSAGIFAAFHLQLSVFLAIQIFFLGLLMAYLMEKTGSVVPGIVVHFLTNFVSMLELIVVMKCSVEG